MFKNTTLSRTFISIFFASTIFFFATSVASATTYEVTGWGWGADDGVVSGVCAFPPCLSGGLGWISFSNKSDQSAIPYGVFIDATTGDFSGYAWSSNIGWVTFNASEMQKCSTNPGDNCIVTGPKPKAHIDITSDPLTGELSGSGKVTGWARACSVFVSGCSGTVYSDTKTGTWDGWISLSGTSPEYGIQGWIYPSAPTRMKFLGPTSPSNPYSPPASIPACSSCYAWGGGTGSNSNTGFGWGINLGGLDVSLVPNSIPPLLSFWADQTTLVNGQSTNLNWRTGGDITSCKATTPGSWAGAKSSSVGYSSVSPSDTQTYDLQCFGPDSASSLDDTPIRTITITVVPMTIPIDGTCGPASGVPSKKMPAMNLCSSGDASLVTQAGDTWQWSCSGTNGGNASPLCTAAKKKDFRIIEI